MMKNKIILYLTIWFCFIACGFNAKGNDRIKIAAIFAKTGTAISHNLEYFPWIDFVVKEVNKQGGVLGKPIELIQLDNKSTPIGSKQAALQAIEDHVVAVIGPAWTSHALAVAPVLQQAGVPMISPIATNPNVTLVGDYIFRACFTDPFQGKVMAEFARRDLKAKTAAVLINVTNDYCIGLAEYFNKRALKNGLQLVLEAKYKDSDIDFTDILNQVKPLKPDVIFVPGYERDSSLIISQARKLGIESIFLGGDGWGKHMYEYSRYQNVGSYFSSHWHPKAAFSTGKKCCRNIIANTAKKPPWIRP